MCTLTFASLSGRLRIAFNRDEQRSRAVALPPRLVQCGERAAIMPIDSATGGTWIGVNSAGLTVCLLNASNSQMLGEMKSAAKQSRGVVVPRLLAAENCREAAEFVQDFDARDLQPFRVIMIERYRWCMAQSDGAELMIHDIRANIQPLMFTSSGLGDDVVEPPRRELFNEAVSSGQFEPQVQDAFHSHRWPERLHLSVYMSRAEAHTVSRTTIELTSLAKMQYEDMVLSDATTPATIELELSRMVGHAKP